MHHHPASVAVLLSDAQFTFTLPGARHHSVRRSRSAVDVLFNEQETHLPENMADAPFEAILVELKTAPAKS